MNFGVNSLYICVSSLNHQFVDTNYVMEAICLCTHSLICFQGDVLFLHMCTSPAQVKPWRSLQHPLRRRRRLTEAGSSGKVHSSLQLMSRVSFVGTAWSNCRCLSARGAAAGQTTKHRELVLHKGSSVNGLSSTFQTRKSVHKARPSWLLSDPVNYTAVFDIASWPLLRLPLTAPLFLVSRRQLLLFRPWCSWRWLSLPSPTSLFRWMARFSRREANKSSSQLRRAIEWLCLHLTRCLCCWHRGILAKCTSMCVLYWVHRTLCTLGIVYYKKLFGMY